jgi:CheY-like chemotaxis protein
VTQPLILVVDDDDLVRDFVATTLTLEKYRIHTATNGRQALVLLEEYSYQLVVSNMGMPLLDGPGLFQECRRRWPGSALPFLFLSGDYEKPDYARFFEEAGVPVLGKPCSPVALAQAVKRLLGLS